MSISKEFKVGLFMISAIAILYLGFNYLKGIDFFSSSNKYYAVYDNVNGLNVSNPVLINGFTVGRVSAIRLLQSNIDQVLVEIDIDGGITLGDSASATLNSDFLGNKSILLFPGDIKKPIEPNDTILAVLDRGITDILAESAQPVANNLESTIKKINVVLDQLASEKGKIDSILMGFQKAAEALRPSIIKTQRSLDSVLTTYNQTGLKISATLDNMQPTLKNFEQLSDSLKVIEYSKTIDQINATLASLSGAVDKLTNNEGTLGKLMTEDSLYINLNRAVQSLDQLLIHIDTQPKHFFAPLGKSAKKIEKDRRKAEKGN
ncbi:MAG: MlaD family protein [Bacteroidota bacterium]